MPRKVNRAVTVDLKEPEPEETAPIDLAAVIRIGLELQAAKPLNDRPTSPQPIVKPVYRKAEVQQTAYVEKWQFNDAARPEHVECVHPTTKLVTRIGINRQHHTNILAVPRSTFIPPERRYYVVRKPIHAASYRIAQLALPRHRLCHATWQNFGHVLDPYHIENCRRVLLTATADDPKAKCQICSADNAVEFFAQKKRHERHERRLRRHERRHQVARLRRQIRALKCKQRVELTVNVLRALFAHTRRFLLANNSASLRPELRPMSDCILQQLCALIGYALPTESGPCGRKRANGGAAVPPLYDAFIRRIADNATIWLHSLTERSGWTQSFGDTVPKCDDGGDGAGGEEGSLEEWPIDDYVGESTDDVSSDSGDESQQTADVCECDCEEYEDEYDVGYEVGEGDECSSSDSEPELPQRSQKLCCAPAVAAEGSCK